MNRSVKITKRLIDILFCSIGLVVAAPFMVAIALAIKLSSPGPVFFKQKRAGMIPAEQGGKAGEFWVYKFRTMVQDAERMSGPILSSEEDPRTIRIGSFLRKTRLDELPQFLNVVRGEMSLVGPRPERPELIDNLSLAIPFFEERMRLVKPGITGLAQVKLSYSGQLAENSNLNEIIDTLINPYDMEELEGALADDMRTKMLYDMVYSASLEGFWSFLRTDMEIILRTPIVMFLSKTGQ
jgi:lipopolysaccharide/colanic/teichoic acid biosynthesis glycosyltransferase